MAYNEAWLIDNSARRCILAKVARYNVGTTSEEFVYLSNAGYMPSTSDVEFLPVISGGLKFSEAITIDGSPSMSFGSIEIDNLSGELDSWVDSDDYVWTNRSVKIYYGDPSWAVTNLAAIEDESQFVLIFDGLISDINSRSRDVLELRLRDKLERLNAPLTEAKLGTFGTWGSSAQSNQDAIKPLVFGEVHNMTPLQVDPSELQYQVCAANANAVIEVRDNGVPIYISGSGTATGAVITNSTGTIGGTTFKLLSTPGGVITTSVQGIKASIDLSDGSLLSTTYNNKIANLIALITTQYGKSYTRLSASDLDLTNLAAFDSANDEPVGVLVNSNANVVVVCQQLANSIGAQINFTRKGKLQLLRLGVPTADTVIDITDTDILANSLSIVNRTGVLAATKLGYCKNWTVQNNLTTDIPTAHKDLFAEEWLTVTSNIDTTMQARYKLTTEPIQKNTMLIVTADATAEANRLTTYFSEPHNIYGFTGTPRMQLLKLGQEVTLTHNRFGLSSTKTGQVISLQPDWSTGMVDVEVIV